MSPRRIVLGLALASAGLAPVRAAGPSEDPPRPATGTTTPTRESPDDAALARARAAFERLTPALQREFGQYLEGETERLGTFQMSLLLWIRGSERLDLATLPERAAIAWFDPAEHAPAQVIERHRLEPDAPLARRAREAILGHVPARALQPAVVYDDGRRAIVRVPVVDEARRVFENALAGYPPHADEAEALLERMLDDGQQSAAALAFGHAYTDRTGGVYPGITLYDAWASGAEIEMPDVDTLGLLHALIPERKDFVAPIPATKQEPLYDLLGERFRALHRQRSLRRALVATWIRGSEPLRDGFVAARDNLHALWEDCSSTPATMAARLPAPDARDAFLAAWAKRCHEPDSPFAAGVRRREVLDADAALVRAVVWRGLVDFGVLRDEDLPR